MVRSTIIHLQWLSIISDSQHLRGHEVVKNSTVSCSQQLMTPEFVAGYQLQQLPSSSPRSTSDASVVSDDVRSNLRLTHPKAVKASSRSASVLAAPMLLWAF